MGQPVPKQPPRSRFQEAIRERDPVRRERMLLQLEREAEAERATYMVGFFALLIFAAIVVGVTWVMLL